MKDVNNWDKELIDKGLIFRNSKDNRKNKITYLLPLSTTCFEVRDKIIRIRRVFICFWTSN